MGKTFLSKGLPFPPDGQLDQIWYELVVNCIRLGNHTYDTTQGGIARQLAPDEASQALQNVLPVTLQAALPVRLSDSHAPTTLSYQLKRIEDRREVALFVYDGKTISIASSGDGFILVVDSHQHGSKGAILLKGEFSQLPDFLKSIEGLLQMNTRSYGNLVFFS